MAITTFAAADEYTHTPTDDPQFNESMYFNLIEEDPAYATLIRMGNRVNEGHAEVTVLVYLPGGAAAFRFERAPIGDNSKFDAGGLRFEVIEPLERLRVTYSGSAYMLSSGTDLENPKAAFAASPEVPVELDLDYRNVVPIYGLGEGEQGLGGIAGAEEAIAAWHYQVPCAVSGTITVDGNARQVSGLGFRDHSWGPRRWQAPRYWRWISCLCDEQNGFVGWVHKTGDTRPPGAGMVLTDGAVQLVRRVEVETIYGSAPYYPQSLEVTLHTGEATWTARGEALSLVPLRNRRDGSTARLAELVCKYDFAGRTGYGFSEYHDVIEDGIPVGMTEA